MTTTIRSETIFTPRGRLTGLIRDAAAEGGGAGRPRLPRTSRRSARAGADEALYYRARLILGEGLPRPRH